MKSKIISLLAAILIFLSGFAVASEIDRLLWERQQKPVPTPIYQPLEQTF